MRSAGAAASHVEAYERYGRALLRKAERILGNSADEQDQVHALFADVYHRADLDLPYLYRAITNRCLSFIRDESNRTRLLERNDIALRGMVRTRCDDEVIGLDLLTKLVRELDQRESEVLAYRYVDDMTQDEIAELLGISRKTVGKKLDRIRQMVARLEEVPS